MTWVERVRGWLAARLAVVGVAPGKPGDGLAPMGASMWEMLDKSWGEQQQELLDVREAWRKNPLARRIVGLVTAYVVGNGVTVTSEYRPLKKFIAAWWAANNMDMRLADWCDALTREGELFVVLYPALDGTTQIRVRPAAVIDEVRVNPEDYEDEWMYHDATLGFQDDDKSWWRGPSQAGPGQPVMLHYAINRPVGSIRGESDLAPILAWLQRYSGWLQDRVRLNAGVRAFLWVVNAPGRLHGSLMEKYTRPPEPGSVVIADEGETWTAVAPNLHANDASNDGRAIRWMITAGGPGTSLLDFGEGEDSNLATGQVMTEMRRRFLRRRQDYVRWMLVDILLHAWRFHVAGRRLSVRPVTVADVTVAMPDISAEDNQTLASAANALADSLVKLGGIVGQSDALRRVALRWFVKFAGEQLSEREFEEILSNGQSDDSTSSSTGDSGAEGGSDGAGVADGAGRGGAVEWRVFAGDGADTDRGWGD